jgi:hypothetical protein
LRPVLLLSLAVVVLVAGVLGFVAARSLGPGTPAESTRVSVAPLPATPTPEPTPTPTATPSTATRRRSSARRDDCPAGCQCDRRPGGITVICQGTGLHLP